MGTTLLFFATLFAVAFILALLYNGYVKFLLWRCKLVCEEKAGLWVLPFWSVVNGFMKFIHVKDRGIDVLYERYTGLAEWIFYQYQDGDYIKVNMANKLAFEIICRRYFAKNSLKSF